MDSVFVVGRSVSVWGLKRPQKIYFETFSLIKKLFLIFSETFKVLFFSKAILM